jgi:serine/threonine-protein kinase
MARERAVKRAAPRRVTENEGEDQQRARREQLDRILRSEAFQHADRLKRFLTFIVEEALAGRETELKEYVIGVQVFRKDATFDPRTDPIVRVQARRLRAKLFRYYREEGRADAVTIELPKGGYAPVFKTRDAPVVLKRSISTALVSRNTVLVQSFADHSPAKDLGHVCQSVRDEVIHHLTQLAGIRVFASWGSEQRQEIEAATKGAALIVGGSIRRAGEQLRLGVYLVDGASGCYLWSEVIDAGLEDTFEAQERVAEAVIRKLEPEVRAGRRVTGFEHPAENLAARNLYLQGRYHINQRTEEGLRKAVDFFERALAEGAEYAPAHSGLADAYGLLAHYGVLAPAEAWTRAASHASTAVTLDGLSAEAHASLAHVKATQDWDWSGAEREFQRAIVLDSSYATAHHWYAMSCLAPLGRLGEALDELVVAQALDPVAPIVGRDIAMTHLFRRDFETALEQCDHTIELNPHFAPAYWTLGVIQEQLRDFDESTAAFQRAVHLSPQTPRMHAALGRTFALSGRRKLAQDVLRKLEAFAKERYVSPMDFAWIHFALGDTEAGFRWLAQAFADRAFDLVWIPVDPRFDALRDDDRFRVLSKQLGLG